MSFWSGLGRAMESNEAQRNVEQQREDRKASEDKAEAFRNKQWSNTLSQQAIANSRAEAAIDLNAVQYKTAQGRLDKAEDARSATARAAGVQAERDYLFKVEGRTYDQSRDVVADLTVARNEHTAAAQQIFDNEVKTIGVDLAQANLELAENRLKETVLQSGVTNAQWDESQRFKVDVFKAGEARADKVFNYNKERHGVTDLAAAYARETAAAQVEYNKTRDEIGDEKAKEAFDQRLVEYGNTLKRQGVTDDQWTQVQSFKIGQANFSNNLSTSEFEYKKERHGVEDIAAAINLEVEATERAYSKTRDNISDDQYQQNLDIRLADLKNKLERQGVSDDQWKQAFDRQGEQQTLAQDNVMFDRKIEILELTESMTKAFSGKGGNAKGGKVPSVNDMNAAAINIRSELGGKQGIDNLGKADKEFFETIMSDPAAAHGIYAFVQTQRVKENNNINILDLPKYINLAGMTAAKGDPDAAARLRSEVLDGDININNVDSLFAGIKALSEYQPAEVVWGVLKAPKKSQDYSADIKLFEESIGNMASARVSTLDKEDPEYQLLYGAIDDLKNSNATIRSRGSNILFDVLGIELLRDMNMEDNPAFRYKIREHKARESADRQERMVRLQETSEGPGGMSSPDLGEESSGMPDRSIQEFTREEAESFMEANPNFRGQLRVDGQLMSNESDGPSRTAPEGLGGTVQRTLPEVPAEVNVDNEEKGYQPTSMMATELNTPAIRDAIAKVPADVKGAVVSIVEENNPEAIEGAISEITEEYGEDVAVVLFTEAGYQPTSMMATELNTPAIRKAISK
tara:strand:- start:3934 stop:6342 length:2409 start_codon:yes stop_codon:yes gene_type:complete